VAVLIGCGLRRGELLALRVDEIPLREEHWVIADLRARPDTSVPSRFQRGSRRRLTHGNKPAVSPRARSFDRSTKLAGSGAAE
jgi:integrase